MAASSIPAKPAAIKGLLLVLAAPVKMLGDGVVVLDEIIDIDNALDDEVEIGAAGVETLEALDDHSAQVLAL